MFEISRFCVNNKLGHLKHLIIIIEMKNKICNRKANKTRRKDMKNCTNQINGNSNMARIFLKFVNFMSTIDQVIQNSLQLQ